ncbi:MAG TPA: histidinol-phosphate transaminase [Gaiellaceae bacterium]
MTDAWLDRLLVPAARRLPSNAEYLAHLSLGGQAGGAIRLASNESTEPPSPRVRDALARAYLDANLSPSPAPPLRAALAARHGTDADRVLLGAGSTEVIDAVLRAFVRAGDEVVLPAPSWPVFRRRLDALEASVVEVPLTRGDDAWEYDVDALLTAVSSRTKLLVVCSPNNPTGNALSAGDLRRCAAAGPLLLLDAAYAEFDGDALTPVALESERVVVTRTFSKAYCLAGLRLGYALGARDVIDHVDRFLVPGSSVSSATLHAGLAALDDEEHLARQVARIRGERVRLTAELRRLGLTAFESRGNFVAVETPVDAAAFAGAVREGGVVIRVMGPRLARITVGRSDENDVLLAAVAAALTPSRA